MLSKLRIFLIFALGVGLGMAYQWFDLHNATQMGLGEKNLIEKVMAHTNVPLIEENNACEGKPVKTVGHVVASLLVSNTENKINKLTYGCFNDTCSISYTDCKPWQHSECSSRFLKFQIDDQQEIKTDTFSCLDIP